jgi:hypothetical protein
MRAAQAWDILAERSSGPGILTLKGNEGHMRRRAFITLLGGATAKGKCRGGVANGPYIGDQGKFLIND